MDKTAAPVAFQSVKADVPAADKYTTVSTERTKEAIVPTEIDVSCTIYARGGCNYYCCYIRFATCIFCIRLILTQGWFG